MRVSCSEALVRTELLVGETICSDILYNGLGILTDCVDKFVLSHERPMFTVLTIDKERMAVVNENMYTVEPL